MALGGRAAPRRLRLPRLLQLLRLPPPPSLPLVLVLLPLLVLLLAAASASGSAIPMDGRLQCMTEMVSRIETSCTSSNKNGFYVQLEGVLRDYLQKCFQTNFTQNWALSVILPNTSVPLSMALKDYAENWSATNGTTTINAVATFIPERQINLEIEFMLENGQAISSNGWLMEPDLLGTVLGAEIDGIKDLTDLVTADPVLDWQGILPQVRERLSMHDGRVYAIPVQSFVDLFAYREDLFAEFNLTVPQTWEEVADVARVWNATDPASRRGAADAMCMTWSKGCEVADMNLITIAAQMVQYAGRTQGFFFDPEELLVQRATSAALLDNEAMRRALELYGALYSAGPWPRPDPLSACNPFQAFRRFAEGNCLMVYGAHVPKTLHQAFATVDRDAIGITVPPGSDMVLNRTTGQLVACTQALCPYARRSADGRRWINAATVSHSSWIACVSDKSPQLYQDVAYDFFRDLAAPNMSWSYLLHPDLCESAPMRTEQFTDLPRWVAAGYSEEFTRKYLRAALASYENPNYVPDLRVAGNGLTEAMLTIYRDAAGNASAMPADALSRVMDSSMQQLLRDPTKTTLTLLISSYAAMIGYDLGGDGGGGGGPVPGGATPSDDDGSGGAPWWLLLAILLPASLVLLGLALMVVYLVRNKRKHRNLWGRVLPPHPGPDTSLLVASIVGVAELRGLLSGNALDASLSVLAAVLRPVLARHGGYVDGGESLGAALGSGDRPFVLAFYSLKDALLFSMDAQAALLAAPWPNELLALPAAAPRYVRMAAQPPRAAALDDDIFDVGPDGRPTRESPDGGSGAGGAGSNNPLSGLLQQRVGTDQSPVIPALTAVPLGEAWTFAEACRHVWSPDDADGESHVLVSRGLAIAVGIHTGLAAEQFEMSGTRLGAAEYMGSGVATARTVAHAAAAGQVLMGEDTYKRLPLERLWDKHLVLHTGEYLMPGSDAPTGLYCALSRALEGRLRLLPQVDCGDGGCAPGGGARSGRLPFQRSATDDAAAPGGGVGGVGGDALSRHSSVLRSSNSGMLASTSGRAAGGVGGSVGRLRRDPVPLDCGVFGAPVGHVTIAFMNVVGVSTLLSWDANVAQPALKLFQAVVSERLRAHGGYLIEAVDGLCLASFRAPSDAVVWALECNKAMLEQEWSEALLAHELCEELVVASAGGDGGVVNKVVFRGLRLKTGVDCGQVLGEVHAMTGRLTYRGKVMNRTARIASTANTGQVLCSRAAWAAAEAAYAGTPGGMPISATPLGEFQLKGVIEKMEILQCHPSVARRAAATRGSGGGTRRHSTVVNTGLIAAAEWHWAKAGQKPAAVAAAAELATTAAAKPAELQRRPSMPGHHRLSVRFDRDSLTPMARECQSAVSPAPVALDERSECADAGADAGARWADALDGRSRSMGTAARWTQALDGRSERADGDADADAAHAGLSRTFNPLWVHEGRMHGDQRDAGGGPYREMYRMGSSADSGRSGMAPAPQRDLAASAPTAASGVLDNAERGGGGGSAAAPQPLQQYNRMAVSVPSEDTGSMLRGDLHDEHGDDSIV